MDLTHPTKIMSWEYHSNYDPNFTAYSSTTTNQVLVLLPYDWNKNVWNQQPAKFNTLQ